MTRKIVFYVGMVFVFFATPGFAACDIDRHKTTFIKVGEYTQIRYDSGSCPKSTNTHTRSTLKFELWLHNARVAQVVGDFPRKNNRLIKLRGDFADTVFTRDYNLRMFVPDAKRPTGWRQVHRLNRVKIKK